MQSTKSKVGPANWWFFTDDNTETDEKQQQKIKSKTWRMSTSRWTIITVQNQQVEAYSVRVVMKHEHGKQKETHTMTMFDYH